MNDLRINSQDRKLWKSSDRKFKISHEKPKPILTTPAKIELSPQFKINHTQLPTEQK